MVVRYFRFMSWEKKQFKKKQTYKPDSVSDKSEPYHLSSPTITQWIYLSTLRQRASHP